MKSSTFDSAVRGQKPDRTRHYQVSTLVVLAAIFPASANATISVHDKITIDGQPARHALITLYDCKTGALVKGPVAVAGDGSVNLTDIDPGKYCLRAEISSGFAEKKDIQIDEQSTSQQIDLIEKTSALSITDRVLPIMLCLATFGMIAYPIGRYLKKPWVFRRDQLIAQFSGQKMRLYYLKFHAGAPIKTTIKDNGKDKQTSKPANDPSLSDGDFPAAFSEDFDRWYGRKYYIAPFVGLGLLTVFNGYWGCVNLWNWASGANSIESMHGLVAASIAGAYTWIISDEIDRLRRRDFTSHDVYYYLFRLLIAIPFGWALTRLQVTLQVGIPLAFFLGAFPTTTLFTAARRIANAQFKLGEDLTQGQLEMEKLQSVGKDVAERFKDEGISTIAQLAHADPLDLTIRTNFEFNYVVDCISQSLLWIFLGDRVKDLQIYSLRGAQEVFTFYSRLYAGEAQAIATLQEMATKLQISKEALQGTLEQVAKDPYTVFLVQIWS
jgi:hypothetical protein